MATRYRSQALTLSFLWLPLILSSFSSAQDIKPSLAVYKPLGRRDSATSYVDLTGLGTDQGFYSKDTLTIQLLEDLPVWTVYNLNANTPGADYFTGLSANGKISARLMIYVDPNSGYVVKKGVVQDLDADVTYDIKPNYHGQDTVTAIKDQDLPPYGDAMVPLWHQFKTLARDPWTAGKGLLQSVGSRLESFRTTEEEKALNDVTLDIMIVWTPNAECAKSFAEEDCNLNDDTFYNMQADIAFWVADTNTVHANSGTGVTFNVVHQQRDTSGYRETGASQQILDDLTNTCHCQLSYIHQRRNEYKADLVTLIADTLRLSSEPVCGIAWCGNICLYNPCYGFSINDVWCTNYYTPAHEFGHNQGCHHDRGTASTQCESDACSCTTRTNFGYRVPGEFRTVMSYDCTRFTTECDGTATASCPQIPYFSGDDEYNGTPMGGTQSNCRGAIMSSKQAIANYR